MFRTARPSVGAFAASSAALMIVGCTGPADSPGSPPAARAGATVVVTVHDLVDMQGGGLAATLRIGERVELPRYEDGTPVPVEWVGGFGTVIDSSPFTFTSAIKEAGEFGQGVFPYTGEDPALVGPGTYTLYVWADTTPLLPYSQWAPASPGPDGTDSLRGCELGVEVTDEDLRLSISGVPPLEKGLLGLCPVG